MLPDYYAEERAAAQRSRRTPWLIWIALAGLLAAVHLLPRRKPGQ